LGPIRVLHQIFAETKFRVSCSGEKAARNLSCNITTPGPLTAPARWVPPTPPSKPLVPRPQPQPQPEDLHLPNNGTLQTPQNCSDISFTHPDWVVNNFEFHSHGSGGTDIVNLNISLTSRPTGVRALCQWESGTAITANGESLLLSCSVDPANIPDGSDSRFKALFNLSEKSLSVQQEWVCGDLSGGSYLYVGGLYSPLTFVLYFSD
jgi:hypothetical protein